MSARTAPTSRGIPKLRYGIALLLGFGVLINYFDRVNLSVASRALDQQFGIGAIGFGVLSSAYSYTYAALQIPVGLALDRYGVATLGRVGALIWSLASFWSGLSGSFASFLGSRLLLGVGEAPTFPGNAKAIAAWLSPFGTRPRDRDLRFGCKARNWHRDPTRIGRRGSARLALGVLFHRRAQLRVLSALFCILPRAKSRRPAR